MEALLYFLAYLGIGFGTFSMVLGAIEGETPLAFFGGVALLGGVLTLVLM